MRLFTFGFIIHPEWSDHNPGTATVSLLAPSSRGITIRHVHNNKHTKKVSVPNQRITRREDWLGCVCCNVLETSTDIYVNAFIGATLWELCPHWLPHKSNPAFLLSFFSKLKQRSYVSRQSVCRDCLLTIQLTHLSGIHQECVKCVQYKRRVAPGGHPGKEKRPASP